MEYTWYFGLIPTMADIQTFNALVDSLAKNNDLLQFNCFGDRKGIIHLRAQFTKNGLVFEDIPKVSMRIKSDRQLKRNQHRAAKWREDGHSQSSSEIPPTDIVINRDQSDSKEIIRNGSDSEKSPKPEVLDPILDCSTVDDTSHNSHHSESMMHCESKQLKESFEVVEAISTPEPSIPIQPITVNQTTDHAPKPSLLPQIKNMFSFNRHHPVTATKQPKPKSSHATANLSIPKEPSSTATPQKPPAELICTHSWCAKGQITTCCECTLQAYPCDYCKDSRTIFKKICDRCKDRF